MKCPITGDEREQTEGSCRASRGARRERGCLGGFDQGLGATAKLEAKRENELPKDMCECGGLARRIRQTRREKGGRGGEELEIPGWR